MATFSFDKRADLTLLEQEQIDSGGQRAVVELGVLWTANNAGTQEYRQGSPPSGTLPAYFLG